MIANPAPAPITLEARGQRSRLLGGLLELEPRLCGVDVRSFTLRMYLELSFENNAFFVEGKAIEAVDVAQFVDRVAVSFRRKGPSAINHIPPSDVAIPAIREYLARSHEFAPLGGLGKLMLEFPSVLIAKATGPLNLPWNEVLDIPFRVLWPIIDFNLGELLKREVS